MKRKDILALLIPSFIFVLAWIGFSIAHNFVTPTISEELNMQITPINPNFDMQTISDIKNRKVVNPIYEISTSSASLSLTPTPPLTALETNLDTDQNTVEPTPPIEEPTETTTEVLPQ